MANQVERVGLRFGNDIRLDLKRERSFPVVIVESVALLLYLLGVLVTVHFTVGTPLNTAVYAAAVLLGVLFPTLYHLRHFRIWVPAALALFALAAFLLREELLDGAKSFWYDLLESVNLYFVTSFSVPFAAGNEYHAALLAVAALCLLSALVGYAVSVSRNVLVLAAAEAPFVWMAVNLREQTLLSGILLLALSFFTVFALWCGDLRTRARPANDDFAVGRRSFFGRRGRRERIHLMDNPARMREGFVKNGFAVLALTLAASLCIGLLVPREEYTWNEALAKFNENPASFLQRFSPQRLAERTSNLGISGGKLGDTDRVEYRDSLQLTVRSDFQAPMYLKGYVGSVYEGTRWTELDASVYRRNRDYFERLTEAKLTPMTLPDGFFVKAQTGQLAVGDAEALSGALRERYRIEDATVAERYELWRSAVEEMQLPLLNNVTVRNEGAASGYIYAPYYLYVNPLYGSWWESSAVTDGALRDDSIRQGSEYRLQAFSFGPSGGHFMEQTGIGWAPILDAFYRTSGEDPALLALSEEYGRFVRAAYTQLPEGLSRLKADYTPALYDTLGLPGAVNRVRSDLSAACAYDLAPGRTPAGEDFVEYFLYENRRGYCMHFASAATLMFRAMGIPARYVEGYLVNREDYIDGHTAEIPDKNAHAWPEIYVEPFGWVPVEVTPGFEMEQVSRYQYGEALEEQEEASSEEVSSEEEASSGPDSSMVSSEELVEGSSSMEETVSSDPQGEEEAPREELPDFVKRLLAAAGVTLGTLLLAGFLLWARRRGAQARRERDFSQRDRSKAAIAVYGYLLELLRHAGFALGNSPPREFARRVAEEWERAMAAKPTGAEAAAFDAAELAEMTEIALEARFSGRQISAAKLEQLRACAERLDEALYGRLGFFGKLWYLYGENLR